MPDSNSSSHRFHRTRVDHLSETASDYCELIEELIAESGRARVGSLAARLGVSPVTVNKTLKRLQREGYVAVEPYQGVTLTPLGTSTALESQKRHRLVVGLLLSLGVSPEVAQLDAEGIEHHVSEETIAAIARALEIKILS